MIKKLILSCLTLLILNQPSFSDEYQELINLLETKEDLSLGQKESLAEELMMFKANPAWPSKVDYGCLNMCKGAIKGMTIAEINSFCMMRCSLKKE